MVHGNLLNFGKRYEDDLRVIFDQWPKLHLGLDVLSNQKILKGVQYIFNQNASIFLVVNGCDDTTYENNTYFSSSSYASPCVLKVCKLSANICQLRLDFDTFVIAQPESSTTPIVTNCIDARFSTTSQGATMPVLCGTNTGKHS